MNLHKQLSKSIFGYARYASLQFSRRVFSTQNDEPVFDMENPFQKEKFQSPYTGRVYGRHITGLCQWQQERIEKEIVKAQGAGLMPVYFKDPVFIKDPKLFDSEKPLRPHRF